MRLKRTYLFIFSLLFWLCSFQQPGYAQPTLGIVWEIPDNEQVRAQQLQLFENIGISHLEVSYSSVSDIDLSLFENYDFSILVRSGLKYYTINTLHTDKAVIEDSIDRLITEYAPFPKIAGLGLLNQSHFTNAEFTSAIDSLFEKYSTQTDKTLYQYMNGKWYPLDNIEAPFGVLLSDQEFEIQDLTDFHENFETIVEQEQEIVVFMHSSWFVEAMQDFPEFRSALSTYRLDQSWIMPLPEQEASRPKANWLVFALVLLWLVLAVQVKFIPNARPMIVRYFFAHRFYVDDILHYRERYATQSIIMMIVHAMAGGIVVYLLTDFLLSDTGLDALYHHLPWLEIFGSGFYSISFLAVITLLILHAVSIFWLYLPAKNLDHVSQIANLYAGLLYTDYITLTLLISFYLTNFSTVLVLVLVTFYVLIGFVNFYVTAYNTARNIGAQKLIYYLITVALHSIIVLSVVIYLLTQTEIIDILSLSLSLT